MEEIKSYNCPECGKQMERGYVASQKNIFWTKEPKSKGIFRFDGKELTSVFFGSPRASALKCPNCRLVLFKYEP